MAIPSGGSQRIDGEVVFFESINPSSNHGKRDNDEVIGSNSTIMDASHDREGLPEAHVVG